MGTGYTRNDTANNIADGNVINASDLDGEFDAVQAAFNGTTGHSHDGTSGEGPQIAAGGIASNAVTTAKILDGNVTTAKIAADAINGTKLADNAVNSEHYTDGSIDRVHLAADIIDGTKIADDVINSEHYVAGSIDAEHLASSSVTTAKIANDAVTLGTKTSGNYVATITAGTGISGSSSTEGGTPTIALAAAGAGAATYGSTADGTKIDTITLDAYGRVTAVATGSTMNNFVLEDGDGTEVTIDGGKEVKFVEGGGVDINWTDTTPGSDADPFDLTFTINTSVTAGNGLTGGGQLNASRTLNVGAGTGIDVAADSISVDVSDFMSNGSNNRIITATGADAMNAETNLTFDGSSLNINGDINAVDNVYVANKIIHEGDTDTYTQFHAANQWRVVTGNTEMLEVNDSYLLLGANSVGNVQTTSVSSSITPNMHVYNSFVLTLTGNITLGSPTTEVTGMSGVFVFIHSGAGRTVSIGAEYETVGGAGLTLSGTSGAVDIVPYYVRSSGNIILGTPQLAVS